MAAIGPRLGPSDTITVHGPKLKSSGTHPDKQLQVLAPSCVAHSDKVLCIPPSLPSGVVESTKTKGESNVDTRAEARAQFKGGLLLDEGDSDDDSDL